MYFIYTAMCQWVIVQNIQSTLQNTHSDDRDVSSENKYTFTLKRWHPVIQDLHEKDLHN